MVHARIRMRRLYRFTNHENSTRVGLPRAVPMKTFVALNSDARKNDDGLFQCERPLCFKPVLSESCEGQRFGQRRLHRSIVNVRGDKDHYFSCRMLVRGSIDLNHIPAFLLHSCHEALMEPNSIHDREIHKRRSKQHKTPDRRSSGARLVPRGPREHHPSRQ